MLLYINTVFMWVESKGKHFKTVTLKVTIKIII